MNASNLPFFNPVTSWESAPPEAIQLSTEQVDQALDQAKQANDPSQLWQRYINGLAQLGFEQWLQMRAPELAIPKTSAQGKADQTILHSPLININGFSVCLLPQSHHPDQFIEMPPALIEGTVPKAHFYVIAAIAEEQSTVEIYAILRQDQLIQKRSLLSQDDEHCYLVPLNWFDGDADSLLLYLRCSEPAAFAQTNNIEAPAKPNQLVQAAVNTALWADGILDAMSQQLAWILMPPPMVMQTGMRGDPSEEMWSSDECSRLIQALRDRGVEIPANLRPAYNDIEILGQSARLYALPRQSDETDPNGVAQWELALILGPAPQQQLSRDIRLIVEDQSEVLVDESFQPGAIADFLYADLSAGVDEIFQVKIKLGNEIVTVLPTFSFQPRQS